MIRAWDAQLAALGHDTAAARVGYGGSFYYRSDRPEDPVAALWTLLSYDNTPAGPTGMDDTTLGGGSGTFLGRIEPTLGKLLLAGADIDWQPPQRPAF